MNLTKSDLENIRTIAENIAPLTRDKNDSIQHLASQMIKLCDILTGDNVEILDPPKPFNQDKAIDGASKASKKKAQTIIESPSKKKTPKK